MRRKIKKKILVISDDFSEGNFETLKELSEPGNIYYSKEADYLSFTFDLVSSFDNVPHKNYDAVLIDYGIVDNEDNIDVIEKLYHRGTILIWCGGLAENYNGDAEVMFPKRTFIHNLPFCTIGHEQILFTLYQNLPKRNNKNK